MITGNRFDQFIDGIQRKIESPDLIVSLGNRLSEQLQLGFGASGLTPRSGATLRALESISEPERTGNGWRIGVGDASALGSESDSAPRGVLRQFFEDNPQIRPSPWRRIPETYKQKLEAMRRAGMYGGRGPNYANYFWAQDQGSTGAHISKRDIVNPALDRWRSEVPYFIEDYFRAQA